VREPLTPGPALASLLQLQRPLTAVDVETTGKSPAVDRVVQLAAVKIWPDGHVIEVNTVFNPGCPIPVEASKIHGLYTLDVEAALPFEALAPELATLLDGDICGYNAKFDCAMLAEEFIRAKVRWVPGEIIDPYRIFAFKETRTLSDAVKFYLGETMTNAHDAIFDIRATVRVLHAQLLTYPDLPRNVEGLSRFFKDQEMDTKIDKEGRLLFGGPKGHKGKLLSEVPVDYLSWIMSADFTPGVKKLVEAELKRRR